LRRNPFRIWSRTVKFLAFRHKELRGNNEFNEFNEFYAINEFYAFYEIYASTRRD
jgi:hypothetical protein